MLRRRLNQSLLDDSQQGITAAKKKKPDKYSHLPDTLPDFALQSDFMLGLPWKKEEADLRSNRTRTPKPQTTGDRGAQYH